MVAWPQNAIIPCHHNHQSAKVIDNVLWCQLEPGTVGIDKHLVGFVLNTVPERIYSLPTPRITAMSRGEIAVVVVVLIGAVLWLHFAL
jgi:hypothetical protein